jgi:hypothetical protein
MKYKNLGIEIKYNKPNISGSVNVEYPNEKPKKQSTKEMFKKMTEFFFKNFCNCKK